MRKLPILLVLLLASLMLPAAVASAHALTVPSPAGAAPFAQAEIEENESEGDEGEGEAADDEGEEEGDDEGEACEDEACEEELELDEAEKCLLRDASASFTAAPGAGQVRLTVHYRAYQPTPVVVDARLHGNKGALHLGSDRARFRRAGVFHYSFALGSKQMAKAIAAKDFEVDLYAVGTPADCEMHLATRGPHRAK